MAIAFEILKPSPELIWERYCQLGSIHRVATEYGTHGERLRQFLMRAGYKLKNARWTDQEIATLASYYSQRPRPTEAVEVAKELKRTVDSIQLKAGKLGLTDRSFVRSQRSRQAASVKTKARIAERGHPNAGKPFGPMSSEHKDAIGSGVVKALSEQRKSSTGVYSEAFRQKQSDRMSALQSTGRLRSGYSRCRSGRREDLGDVYFRSAWEANIARYLNWLISLEVIHRWEYEAETFCFEEIKRGTRHYTPDFKLWDTPDSQPYFWEVKGWMDQKSRTKLERMARYFPDARIVVIDQRAYKAIERQVAGVIENWESGTRR